MFSLSLSHTHTFSLSLSLSVSGRCYNEGSWRKLAIGRSHVPFTHTKLRFTLIRCSNSHTYIISVSLLFHIFSISVFCWFSLNVLLQSPSFLPFLFFVFYIFPFFIFLQIHHLSLCLCSCCHIPFFTFFLSISFFFTFYFSHSLSLFLSIFLFQSLCFWVFNFCFPFSDSFCLFLSFFDPSLSLSLSLGGVVLIT